MKAIFKHEVKYYIKNIKEASYLYSYFLLVIMLVPFTTRFQANDLQQLAPIALWVALTSGITMASSGIFQRDMDQGRLEYYQLLPCSLETIVFAKWLAFFMFIGMPLILTLPVAGLLFHLDAASVIHDGLGLFAGALALSIASILIAALMAGLEKTNMILNLAVLPLSLPIIIFGAEYCHESSGLWSAKLAFILGYALFMIPLMCFAGAYSIRCSN